MSFHMHYHVEKLSGVKSCLLCLVESAILSVLHVADVQRGPHMKDILRTGQPTKPNELVSYANKVHSSMQRSF